MSTCFSSDRSATRRLRRVLPLQVLHSLGLIKLKTTVFLPPAIIALLRYSGFPSIWRSSTTICSALNLFFDITKAPFQAHFLNKAWSKKARSGQQFRDPLTPDWRDNAELGEVRSDRINHRGLLADEQMAGAVKHQAALLLRRLVGTNRMLALVTPSQIASASAMSFFCRLT